MPRDQERTISELLRSYADSHPNEIPTLQSVLKNIVLPGLGIQAQDVRELRDRLEIIPAHQLYAVLGDGRRAWAERVRRSLPSTETYQKAYLRAVKRLVDHGERLGFIHPDEYEISPPWRELIARLRPLTCGLAPHKRSMLRCAFKSLARWATTTGLAPTDLPGDRREGGRYMDAFYRTFDPRRDRDFYQARQAWNMVVRSHPELGLVEWGHEQPFLCRGIPKEKWPPCLYRDFQLLVERHALDSWAPATIGGYESRIANYLGALHDQGLSIDALLMGAKGLDALRLLFQGVPASFSAMDAAAFVERLSFDEAFREAMLVAMRELSGSYDGRESGPNPIMTLAISAWMAEDKAASAHDLLTKALAINRGILGMTDRHVLWCLRRRQAICLAMRRNPSDYSLKKKAVFRTPTFWRTLVSARTRLRIHSASLETEWRQSCGQRRAQLRATWAVAKRNEVLFGLLLCYPLRVGNLSAMRLGEHYDPLHHRIFFPAEQSKNGKEIDYELPEGGSLGDLRHLVEDYLEEARPALLEGRVSDFFFVPGRMGGTRVRSKGFNSILAEISRTFLAELLPAGMRELNPHLLRHVVATHLLAVERDLNLAAQMLNDSPSTITKSYADVLGCKKEATKAYLSQFTL